MAKAKTLKKDELESVRKAVGAANSLTTQLGQLELQKAHLLSQALTANAQVQEEQKLLEETYGSVSVNLETGEITETVEEAVEV
jgi:allophanate hydrolase subunit 1|tara:strand:+ start:532 stop:783 length:252 start_codon:yes stop_codon:yes gene_type:complete